MKYASRNFLPLLGAALAAVIGAAPSYARQSDNALHGELRAAVQNPLADLISLPFQNNTSFGIDPHGRTQNTLNIQPVYPVQMGDWLPVNRVILPVVCQPDIASDSGGEWGLGPIALIPTSSKDETGAGEWGLASNLWSVGGGAGELFHVGKPPVNTPAQAFTVVEKPAGGPDWQLRLQVQLLFAK